MNEIKALCLPVTESRLLADNSNNGDGPDYIWAHMEIAGLRFHAIQLCHKHTRGHSGDLPSNVF